MNPAPTPLRGALRYLEARSGAEPATLVQRAVGDLETALSRQPSLARDFSDVLEEARGAARRAGSR